MSSFSSFEDQTRFTEYDFNDALRCAVLFLTTEKILEDYAVQKNIGVAHASSIPTSFPVDIVPRLTPALLKACTKSMHQEENEYHAALKKQNDEDNMTQEERPQQSLLPSHHPPDSSTKPKQANQGLSLIRFRRYFLALFALDETDSEKLFNRLTLTERKVLRTLLHAILTAGPST